MVIGNHIVSNNIVGTIPNGVVVVRDVNATAAIGRATVALERLVITNQVLLDGCFSHRAHNGA